MRRIGAILCVVFVGSAILVGMPRQLKGGFLQQCTTLCGRWGTPLCNPNPMVNCVCTDVQTNCFAYCNGPAPCE
jgi:hypothetical protein